MGVKGRGFSGTTYVHRVVLVELGLLRVDLAHQDDERGDASEQASPGSVVGLPGIDQVRDAVLEHLAVNLDFGHDGRRGNRAMVDGKTCPAMRVVMQKAGLVLRLRKM